MPLEEKAQSGYFSAIAINQASPGRRLVVLEKFGWVRQEIRGIPVKRNVSEASGADQTPAWAAADSILCTDDLYIHSKSEAAGVCLVSGMCTA